MFRFRSVSVAAFGAAACVPSDADHSFPHTVVDSAGVEIVTYSGDTRAPVTWALGEEPVLQLGVVGDGSPETFYRITAVALAGERLYVANMGSDEVRAFNLDGRFLRSIGRSGYGPGEFKRIAVLETLGTDTLLTYSGGTDRFILFNPDGAVIDEFRTTEGIEGLSFPGAFLPDRTILSVDVAAAVQLQRPGEIVDSADLVLFDLTGRHIRDVGRVPFARRYMIRHGERKSVGGVTFAPVTRMAAWNRGFCLATAERYAFQCHEGDGAVRRIVRWERELRRVTREDIEAYRARSLKETPPERQAIVRAMLENEPMASSFPAFRRMLSDPDGGVWLEEFRGPRDERSHWHRFSAAGRYTGSVVMPERFVLLDVGERAVAGVWRDESDVEYVRVYPLLLP